MKLAVAPATAQNGLQEPMLPGSPGSSFLDLQGIGPATAVAPFYHAFTVWAVISGQLVFRQFLNALAVAGVLLVIACGLAVGYADYVDERKRKLTVVG